MTQGPASVPAARVPRSRLDDNYAMATPLPAIRVGTGVVVSVDGDTCTVLMFDEEIVGVVWLGKSPPAVGDTVEVEARGDLLVIPAEFDDTYAEGMASDAVHIVDDDVPDLPPAEVVNIAGSMRAISAWNFDANAHGWRRELTDAGIGVRAWQAAGTLQSRNACPTPSFETGLGAWHSNSVFGGQALATLTQDAGRFVFGTKSMRVDWPAKGTFYGSNAVHAKFALTAGTRWVASLHVYIPEGSPDVRATDLFTANGPWITAREQWVWTEVEFVAPADGSGTYFGIATNDPALGTMCWVDAVVLRAAGTPLPPGLSYFDGSIPNTAEMSFAWEGTAYASASTWYNGQLGTPGTGILWSTEAFEVAPGDTLDLAAIASKTAGADASIQLAICYSPDDTRLPLTLTDPVIAYGAAVPITAAETPVVAQATVPVTLPDGISVPRVAVIGFKLVGPGTSDLVIDTADLTRTAGSWPIGSLWLNPAGVPSTPETVAPWATSTGSVTDLSPVSPINTPFPVPASKKVLVTAPPEVGGFVFVIFTASVQVTTIPSTVDFRLFNPAAGASTLWQARFFWPSGTVGAPTEPFTLCGFFPVNAGETLEVIPQYQFAAASGAARTIRAHTQAVFLPGAIPVDTVALPMTSFWDGDSWRVAKLPNAAIDTSKDAATVEPGKTATTTTFARSDGDVHAGTNVTLTATVTPAAAAGTVTFYRGTSASGPWTNLGTAPLSSSTSKATKTTTVNSAGTWYYKATYGGSSTHASSTSGATTIRFRTKRTSTKLLTARWVCPYSADGSKVTIGDYTDAAQQGDVGGGSSNRRSLIGFVQPNFGTVSELDVVRVTLTCTDWQQWKVSNGIGTLVAGWHEVTAATEPNVYPFDKTHNDRSRHGVDEKSWAVNLSSWAPGVVMRSDFGGITVGPGVSMAAEYGGWSNNGANKWKLEVEATYWA